MTARYSHKSLLRKEIARREWQVHLWKAVRDFSSDPNWKIVQEQFQAIREFSLERLLSKDGSHEDIRFEQGRLDMLDYFLGFSEQPEASLQRYQSELQHLQDQLESFDTVARSEGRDPDIENVYRELRSDHNPR